MKKKTKRIQINKQFQSEIKNRKRIESLLEERLQFEKLLTEISAAFVNPLSGKIDVQIEHCLERIVELLKIDRCTMAEFSGDHQHLVVTHSWAVSGVKPFPSVEISQIFPWLFHRLVRGDLVRFSGIEDLPEIAIHEKQYMAEKGQVSGLLISLKAGLNLVGVVFLETMKAGREWQDDLVCRLQIMGEVFANALLRQRVENELKASEERYRSLVEDRPGFIVRWLPTGELLFANRNYCRYFGKSPEQSSQFSFTESIHPEDRQSSENQIRNLHSDNPTHAGERRILLPDGTIAWHHWTDRALFNEAGEIILLESTGHDISEQKTSEKAIRNIAEEITGLVGERFFKSLMNYLSDALEADHAIIARLSKNHPQSIKVIEAFSRGNFLDEFQLDLTDSPIEKIITDGYALLTKDLGRGFHDSRFAREWQIDSMSGTLLVDSKTNPIGILAVMNSKAFKNENLTKNILQLFAFRAAAELEREQSDLELRKSEQLFRMLAENAKDMIFRASLPDGKYEYASPASLDITGYTPEEISRFQTFSEFVKAIIHPALAHDFNQIWEKFQAGKMRPYYEYKIIRKSGEERWVHQRSVLAYDQTGQIVAIEGIVTDITERKNLENKILEMQKMQAIGTLAGGIAHDFNNILGVIIGNAEMIEMFDLPKKTPIRSRLKKLIDAGYRAKELINQILTSASMSEHTKQTIPLKPIVKDAIKFLRSSLPSTIDINLNIESPDISISGDPVQIQRVLINLGTNAGQAMEMKKGKLTVILSKIGHSEIAENIPADFKPGQYALLTVEDTGKGMEQTVMERIFEPYFTTKQYGEGIGLGLAVVHGIIKNHRGFISVKSQPGQGSVFKIYLPISVDMIREKDIPRPTTLVKGSERILFVDDDIFIVDVYREILEKYGYRVISKDSAQEAFSIFSLQPYDFDLVITDMTMPQMTGEELIREILKIRSEIPIILCTGYNIKMDPDTLRELNVKEFIKKPIGARQLAGKIREVLDKNKASG